MDRPRLRTKFSIIQKMLDDNPRDWHEVFNDVLDKLEFCKRKETIGNQNRSGGKRKGKESEAQSEQSPEKGTDVEIG